MWTSLLVLAQGFGSDTVIYQQSEPPIWASAMTICLGLSVSLVISAIIAFLVYNAQKAVPPQHRKIDPNMIWLMLIPLFNLVWNFFVFQRVPESYQSYFASIGRPEVGEKEKKLGLWLAICAACSIIPCVGVLAGLAALVLLIMFLINIYGYKAQIPPSAGTNLPPVPPQV